MPMVTVVVCGAARMVLGSGTSAGGLIAPSLGSVGSSWELFPVRCGSDIVSTRVWTCCGFALGYVALPDLRRAPPLFFVCPHPYFYAPVIGPALFFRPAGIR